jgi:hypothetical protein
MEWLLGFKSSACFQDQYSFVHLEDYKLWAKGRHPASNAYAYFDMVRERNYATRLEF